MIVLIIFSNVDFPLPFSPDIITDSPQFIENDASIITGLEANDLTSLFIINEGKFIVLI
tara:strand:+ start:2963 stop:3139 length:177 start_codon:yes stop_codon:yes gene_type:complete